MARALSLPTSRPDSAGKRVSFGQST